MTTILQLANNINTVNESGMIEEEFLQDKNYKINKHSDQKLISDNKMSDFFKVNFKVKNIKLQPEVTSPKNNTYIIPPDDLHINNQAPEVAEVQDVLKHLKIENA